MNHPDFAKRGWGLLSAFLLSVHLGVAPKCFVLSWTVCAHSWRMMWVHVRKGPCILSSRAEKFHGEGSLLAALAFFSSVFLYLLPSLDQNILWVTQAFYLVHLQDWWCWANGFKSYLTMGMFVKSHLNLLKVFRFGSPLICIPLPWVLWFQNKDFRFLELERFQSQVGVDQTRHGRLQTS